MTGQLPDVTNRRGMVFKHLRVDCYRRKTDGVLINVDVYQGHCAQCGAPFETFTPFNCDSPETNGAFGRIHCDAHKLTMEEAKARWVAAVTEGKRRKALERARA